MLTVLKDASKKLPFPLFLRLYDAQFEIFGNRHEKRNRRRLRLPRLDELDLPSRRRSDTLFILGSGASINEISPARWDAMSHHDSIGLNNWVFHPFVPTFYMVEAYELRLDPEFASEYNRAAVKRARDYARTVKIVTGTWRRGELDLTLWDEAWLRGFYVAHDLQTPARNESELRAALAYRMARGKLSPATRFFEFPKHASSVTAALGFGARAGFRRIVLCGVDLSSARYFLDDPRYGAAKGMSTPPAGTQHVTNIAITWRVPAARAIVALRDIVLRPMGIDLFVENPASALHPEVPLAPAELFEGAHGRTVVR